MSYPSDWFSDPSAPSFLIFGTSQKAVESIEPSATDGVVILLTDSTEYYDTTDPVVALEQFVTEMTLEDDASLRGKIATTTIKGKPAATATIDGESNSGLPLTAYFTTIVDGDWIATFIGTSPTAVEADFHDIFVAMVETIELREPTGTAEVGGMTDSEGFLFYGETIDATLNKEGIGAWSFIGLKGEVIDITVVPNSSGLLDVQIDIQNEKGKSILDWPVDNSFGTEELLGFELPADGAYVIVIEELYGTRGDYTITLAESGSTTTSEVEGDIVAIDPGSVLEYSLLYSSFVAGDDSSTFTFTGKGGEFADISVSPESVGLDVVIDFLDPSGQSLLDGPLDNSYNTEYIRVLRMPEDGDYTVVVSSYDGAPGDFELLVEESYLSNPASFILASGSLDDAEEVHDFPFYTYADELVVFHAKPEFGLDVVVELYNDDTGELLEEKDASTGFEEVVFFVPEDGNYKFSLVGYAGSTGAYDVTLIGSEFVYFELAVGDLVIGRFGPNSLFEYYISGTAGDTVNITIKTEDGIDLILELMDFDSNILASADNGGKGVQETLSYTFESDDLLILRVGDYTESGMGEFVLSVE